MKITIEITNLHENEDVADWTTAPEVLLREKAELLAEFLGCDVDDAERIILNRVCAIATGH